MSLKSLNVLSALKPSEHMLMERVSKRTYKEERDMEKSGQTIIRRT